MAELRTVEHVLAGQRRKLHRNDDFCSGAFRLEGGGRYGLRSCRRPLGSASGQRAGDNTPIAGISASLPGPIGYDSAGIPRAAATGQRADGP